MPVKSRLSAFRLAKQIVSRATGLLLLASGLAVILLSVAAFAPRSAMANQSAVAQAGTFVDSGQSLDNSISESVTLGDLDGDSDLDAFVGNYYEDNKVWLNNGGIQGGTPGVFVNSGQSLGWLAWSESVALGDLDGDGDLDAFVGNSTANQNG